MFVAKNGQHVNSALDHETTPPSATGGYSLLVCTNCVANTANATALSTYDAPVHSESESLVVTIVYNSLITNR